MFVFSFRGAGALFRYSAAHFRYKLARVSMFQYESACSRTSQYALLHYETVYLSTSRYVTYRFSMLQVSTVQRVSGKLSTFQCNTKYSASQYVLVEAACSVQVSTCQYVSVRVSAFQYKSVRFTTSRYVSVCFSTIEYASVRIRTWPEKTRKQKQKKSQWHHKNKQTKDQTRTLAFWRATTFFDSWLLRPHNRLMQSLCYP